MGSATVVMGVSGCGKSTVGAELAKLLGAEFVDGDDLHPPANRAKMASGTPLTDEDRWPWLELVRARLAQGLAGETGVVIACSALKRDYRDRLREAGAGLRFVYLQVSQAEVERRLTGRSGHFFPAKLVASQFATLEEPGADEQSDVLTLGAGVAPAKQAVLAHGMLARAQ